MSMRAPSRPGGCPDLGLPNYLALRSPGTIRGLGFEAWTLESAGLVPSAGSPLGPKRIGDFLEERSENLWARGWNSFILARAPGLRASSSWPSESVWALKSPPPARILSCVFESRSDCLLDLGTRLGLSVKLVIDPQSAPYLAQSSEELVEADGLKFLLVLRSVRGRGACSVLVAVRSTARDPEIQRCRFGSGSSSSDSGSPLFFVEKYVDDARLRPLPPFTRPPVL